jgi:xanthine dehydrogenase YagT iron-sulfur-binding subunit
MDKPHDPKQGQTGLSRRGFFNTAAVGATGAALVTAAAPAEAQEIVEGELVKLALNVNGISHTLMVEPRWTLVHVLRDRLGLTGTKPGCERGECGACTVLIDGVAQYSCMTLALEAEGRRITTLEGLLQDDKLGPVQEGFRLEDGYQCGFCTPGQMMATEGLLRKTPNPGVEQIREGLSGNLCRCGAYAHIFKSVQRAAALRKAGS